MDAILRFITRRAGWVLIAIAALTVFAASRIVDLRTGVPTLYLDPSINSLLPANDESRRFYQYVQRLFGGDDTLVLAIVDPKGVFHEERLRAIKRMTERIEEVDGVHHAVSLANALNIRSSDDELRIEPFLPEHIPRDPAALRRILEEALDNPVYAGNLVSRDGTATAVVVHLRDIPEREFLDFAIDRRVRRIAEEEGGDATIWMTGSASIKAESSRTLLADLAQTAPIIVAIMGVVALVSFRSLRGVVVSLATIVIALVWTLAVIAVTVGKLNVVTVLVPPLILVVGFAYAVHVVSAYYASLREQREEANGGDVLAALRHVALPVLLTGATTAAGFLSLSVSPLGAIKQFALASTVGVISATVVAVTFAPALLQVLPAPRRLRTGSSGARLDRLFEALARFDHRHRGAIFAAAALVGVISLLGMTRIQVSTDFVSNFEPDSPVRRNFDAVNESLEGATVFYVVLRADYANAFTEPVNLLEVQKLQTWLEAQDEIGGTTSLVDYLMLINRGFHDDDPEFLRIPKSQRLSSQLLLVGANDEIWSFTDSRYQTVNVHVRSKASESGELAALVDRIEEHLEALPARIEATVTGYTVLLTRTIDDIAFGQALSLSMAFLVIYAILSLLFTSPRVGLIALLPNLLPVVVYFGVLGLTGVTLNATTGLVACLVLGIAVDDTIHYLARFNVEAKRWADEAKGVVEALRTVGRPITYTTVALCLGFLVLTTASLRNLVEFGALASFTLFVAWLMDVTFTPALAARMGIVTLWEVLTLDLGEDPHKSIPLFHGLSKTQARIVVLMTSLRSYPKGHRLFHLGEKGNDMFVVIDGRLVASVPGEKGSIRLTEHRRGDVVGEVGVFQGKRSADVVALTELTLVRLTSENLERIKRRHPRIGAQLYQNLSRILADRLTALTTRVS